jgi:hypothetical protein
MEENLDENPKTKKSLKSMLLILIAVLAIVVLVLGGILFVIGRGNSDSKNLKLIFDEDKLIPVKVDNLYGYISPKNGKMVINPNFKSANAFYGNYASVSYDENGSTKYGIIDKSGKVKLSTAYSSGITVLSEYGLFIVDNVLYNNNLKALTDKTTKVDYEDLGYCSYIKYDKNGKSVQGGIINSKGKKVYSYKFKDSENFFACHISSADESLGETYAVVNVNNEKYAIVNLANGKVVYNYSDKYISAEKDNIFTISTLNGDSASATILCISKNKIAYETSDYSSVSYYDYEKKILELRDSNASYSNRYKYYDMKNKSILSEKPEKSSTDSLAALIGYNSYSNNSKYGIMKADKVILTCDYDEFEFLSPTTFNYIKSKKNQELVLAKKDNEYSLINLKNKKTITSFKASSVTTYSTSTFIKGKLKDSGENFVYNMSTGKTMTFDSKATVSVYSNYITVSKDGTLTYYNTNLKEIYKI